MQTIYQLESARISEDGNIEVLNDDAFRLTQWLEKGVFEALARKYVKTVTFAILVGGEKHPKVLETYTFEIGYAKVGVKMLPTLNGVVATKENLKKQACTFIRNLTVFAGSLDIIPEERWLNMKLTYVDDTPVEYEPEYFTAQTEQTTYKFPANEKVLRIKIGQVSSSNHSMQLRFSHIDDTVFEELRSSSDLTSVPQSIFHSSGNDNIHNEDVASNIDDNRTDYQGEKTTLTPVQTPTREDEKESNEILDIKSIQQRMIDRM